MGVVVRFDAVAVRDGDTARYRVVLASGTVIGWVMQSPEGFAVRVPWGSAVPAWIAQGDTESFSTLADAAAAVWLGFMSAGCDGDRPSPPA